MAIYRLADRRPTVHSTSYIAPEATIIGDVVVEAGASIWPGAVLRADDERIVVSRGANVQDGAILHADPGYPLTVGPDATVGHLAMLHGCTIGDGALIGIHATVLNGAEIGPRSLVGAGALVCEGERFPAQTLVLGAPARVKRELTEEDVANLRKTAQRYAARARNYVLHLHRVDPPQS